MTMRNLLIIQGGGPTQVLNTTLAAIVTEAQARPEFDRIFGASWGMRGLVAGKVARLDTLTPCDLDSVRATPGTVLGSSRFSPSPEDLGRALEHLRGLSIRDIVFIGGNGTMRGAQIVSQFCRDSGFDVRVIGVPKTVDNDIGLTDRCPGYGSAARFIAQSARDLGIDVRSLPQPVSILETMGRSVGWLAAAAAAGKRDEEDAPHIVCLPEVPFDLESFLGRVENLVARRGWAIAVTAEGICDAAGNPVWQSDNAGQADELRRPLTGGVGSWLADVVARRLGLRCRCEKPGLLGRASMLHVSAQDAKDAELAGRAGVRGLLAGESDTMVALLPLSAPGERGYTFVPLSAVSGTERRIPADWIAAGAIPVKDSFFRYLHPLVGDLLPTHPFLLPASDGGH
jgi:ATP-dependent phosphofructokinase / diphosphate-dependent phosphofructokinase